MENICVFDLDGTLWKENSHVEVVRKYGKAWLSRFPKIFESVYAKIFPQKYQLYLNSAIEKIPEEFLEHIEFTYRKHAIMILNKRKCEGDKVLIISSAPRKILSVASEKFKVICLHANIGMKDKVLQNSCSQWDRLTVVTDNLTDANLLLLADRVVIYSSKMRKMKFEKLKLKGEVCYQSKKVE